MAFAAGIAVGLTVGLAIGDDDDERAETAFASTTTAPPATSAPSNAASALEGYLGNGITDDGHGFVWYLRFRERDGTLSGTFQYVERREAGETESTNGRVTGSIDDRDVTLTFNFGPGGLFRGGGEDVEVDLFGQMTTDGLLWLDVPLEGGQLSPIAFRPADVTEFNAEVDRLRSGS